MIISLPIKMFDVLKVLADIIDKEFYIELPIKRTSAYTIKVSNRIFIPDQTVSYSTISIETGLGKNVFGIHVHPENMPYFSFTDEKSINQKIFISAIIPRNVFEWRKPAISDYTINGEFRPEYDFIFNDEDVVIEDIGLIKFRRGKKIYYYNPEKLEEILNEEKEEDLLW